MTMDSTFPLELDLVLGTDMAVTSGCLLTPFCELPSDPWGHVVLSLVVVSVSDQILAHILHFAASKGCPVVKPSVQHSGLPSQQFDQLSNLFKKLWLEHEYFFINVLKESADYCWWN